MQVKGWGAIDGGSDLSHPNQFLFPVNSYFSRNTLLKGFLPGLVLSIAEVLLEFVYGLRSIWVLEILVLLTILNLLGQAIWMLVLAIRREFKVCIAAFCMLLVYLGLSRLSYDVYLYGASIYVHRHINLWALHEWAVEELENHPDGGNVYLRKDDGNSRYIFQMLQQPEELFVIRTLDGTSELCVAWRGLGVWFASPGQGQVAKGRLEISDGVYLGINPTRQ